MNCLYCGQDVIEWVFGDNSFNERFKMAEDCPYELEHMMVEEVLS
jgi:hypothetical protein